MFRDTLNIAAKVCVCSISELGCRWQQHIIQKTRKKKRMEFGEYRVFCGKIEILNKNLNKDFLLS